MHEDAYSIPYKQNDIETGRLYIDGHIMCKRFVSLRADQIQKNPRAKFKPQIYEKVIDKSQKDIIEQKA